MKWIRRVPALLWLALIPAVMIGAVQLRTGGGMPVHVVGSGPLLLLEADDAPEDTFFRFYIEPRETLKETSERALTNLGLWPDMIVIGFDDSALMFPMSPVEEAEARRQIRAIAEGAENAAAVAVILNFRIPAGADTEYRARVEGMNLWMREDLCLRSALRHCVDISTRGGDVAGARRAISEAVAAAKTPADELRESIVTWR